MRRCFGFIVGVLLATCALGRSYQETSYQAAAVGDKDFRGRFILKDGTIVGEQKGLPAMAASNKGAYGQPTLLAVPENSNRKGTIVGACGTAVLIDWGEKNKKTVFDFKSGKDLTPKKGGDVLLVRLFGMNDRGQAVGHVAHRSGGETTISPAIFSSTGSGTPKTLPGSEKGWTGELSCASGEWAGGNAQDENDAQKALVVRPSGAWEHPCDKQQGVEASVVSGINAKGEAIGRMKIKGAEIPFLWTPQDGLQRLEGKGSKINAISSSGVIVGANDGKAAAYDRKTKVWVDLNLSIKGLSTNLTEAVAVNDDGQVLVRGEDGKTYVLSPKK